MWVSELEKSNLTEDIVDRILYKGLEDSGESADCVLVLGSIKATEYRIPIAVSAYKNNRAPKILLSGGSVRNFEDGRMGEAERMLNAALELGVKREDIILEKESQNTVENMLASLMALHRAFWINKVKRVLLVTTTFHMRRSIQLARYLFPDHIEVLPCPADDINTRRENWYKTEAGRERAMGEVFKIMESVENGLFPDFEI